MIIGNYILYLDLMYAIKNILYLLSFFCFTIFYFYNNIYFLFLTFFLFYFIYDAEKAIKYIRENRLKFIDNIDDYLYLKSS